MTLLRGAAEDCTVEDWFNRHIWRYERALRPEDVYWGTLLGAAEMLLAGVTCAADHYFHMDRAWEAYRESGMRADLAWAVFGTGEGWERQWAQALEFSRAFAGRDPRLTVSLGPHSPYICPESFLRTAAEAADGAEPEAAHPRRGGIRPAGAQPGGEGLHAGGGPGADRDPAPGNAAGPRLLGHGPRLVADPRARRRGGALPQDLPEVRGRQRFPAAGPGRRRGRGPGHRRPGLRQQPGHLRGGAGRGPAGQGGAQGRARGPHRGGAAPVSTAAGSCWACPATAAWRRAPWPTWCCWTRAPRP